MLRVFIITLTAAVCFALSTHAELRTITLDSSLTNSSATLVVTEQQTIELKTATPVLASCGAIDGPLLVWNVNGITFTNQLGAEIAPRPVIFTGPASVRIIAPNCPTSRGLATFDIQPAAFPPDKALTLGAFSGNVKVTMEESTDLVNWTQATSGQVHTNAPDARFFRIRMEKNSPPPP